MPIAKRREGCDLRPINPIGSLPNVPIIIAGASAAIVAVAADQPHLVVKNDQAKLRSAAKRGRGGGAGPSGPIRRIPDVVIVSSPVNSADNPHVAVEYR